ncbi:MAG: LysM domain-containing protein [Acidobacteriota bacterium]
MSTNRFFTGIILVIGCAAVLSAQPERSQGLLVETGKFSFATAKAGDTVQVIADRVGADPVAVAKLNGLLPNSILGAGRTIKIPRPLTVCRKSLPESPELRGLKLGMSKSDLVALLRPEVRNSFESLQSAPDYYFIDRSRFDGMRRLNVEFFAGKVSLLTIQYGPGVEWDSDEEFVGVVSEKFGLPANGWERDSTSYVMNCGDFQIEAKRNEINLVDLTATKSKSESDRIATEQKKKAFKP